MAKVKDRNEKKLEVNLPVDIKVELNKLAKRKGSNMSAIVKDLVFNHIREERMKDGLEAGNVVQFPVKKPKEMVQPVEVNLPDYVDTFFTDGRY